MVKQTGIEKKYGTAKKMLDHFKELLVTWTKGAKDNKKLEKLFYEQRARVYRQSPKLGTRAGWLSQSNNVVKSVLGDEIYFHQSLPILKLTPIEKQELEYAKRKKEVEQLRSQVLVDGLRYQNAIQMLSKSNDPADLMACISLATGRRSVEISKTAEFEEIPWDGDDANLRKIRFRGQLKLRKALNMPGTEERKATQKAMGNEREERSKMTWYEIPMLELSPKELIAVWKRLRKMLDYTNITEQEASSLTSGPLNRALRRLGLGKTEDITSGTIRAAYSYICGQMFRPDRWSSTAYQAAILGHSYTDICTAARAYQKVSVINYDAFGVFAAQFWPLEKRQRAAAREDRRAKEFSEKTKDEKKAILDATPRAYVVPANPYIKAGREAENRAAGKQDWEEPELEIKSVPSRNAQKIIEAEWPQKNAERKRAHEARVKARLAEAQAKEDELDAAKNLATLSIKPKPAEHLKFTELKPRKRASSAPSRVALRHRIKQRQAKRPKAMGGAISDDSQTEESCSECDDDGYDDEIN